MEEIAIIESLFSRLESSPSSLALLAFLTAFCLIKAVIKLVIKTERMKFEKSLNDKVSKEELDELKNKYHQIDNRIVVLESKD